MISHLKTRTVSTLALALLMLGAASPLPLQAAPPETDISGRLLDEDGVSPVQDVVVRLKNRTSGQVYESKATDARGEYKIPNVPDGEYSIFVVSGAEEFELPNRLNILGGQPSSITVILTAAASQASQSGKPDEGGRSRKSAVLIPVIGSIFVAAFAASEYFEKDGDGSPKLP